ncbi:MAG TPA: hypothetical protein VFB49_08980 [Patescibacteria group bacterium]|nr:hypothetical protein [Patescibacteria group bacterium]
MTRSRAFRAALPLAALLLGAPRSFCVAAIDSLPALLADDWDEARQRAAQERVRALGAAACPTLSGYSGAPDPRAREHAVRAMADALCPDLSDYRGFFADRSAWVVDALIDALGRLRIETGVPFLIAHVDDRRRLVSDDGAREIADQADRQLRRLTAQPIPRLPAVHGAGAVGDPAAWRAWYASHGAEAPAVWIGSGLDAIRRDLAGESVTRRLVALDTLALVGTPGRAALAEALRRGPSDLEVGLVCLPEQAPRVLDRIPCSLTITNVGARRLVLALGDAVVHLELHTAPDASAPASSGRSPGKAGSSKTAPAGPLPAGPPPGGHPPAGHPPGDRAGASADASGAQDADLALLEGRFLDLLPGASVRREVSVGPVNTAGRYEVRAGMTDLARPLLAGPQGAGPGPIETVAVIRFEP